jgi:hypothetical protein
MGARNQVGIGLSCWPARLHSLAELVSWNRFLGVLKDQKFGLRTQDELKYFDIRKKCKDTQKHRTARW